MSEVILSCSTNLQMLFIHAAPFIKPCQALTGHSEHGGEQDSWSPSMNLHVSKITEQIIIKPNKRDNYKL